MLVQFGASRPATRARHLARTAAVVSALALAATLCVGAQAPAGGSPAAAASDGKSIYDAHCANCHGTAGKGDGPASSLLRVRPRDFTSGRFKLRSTESGGLPTDDDLLKTIKTGMHGS